jgi:hypothetical protein
MQSKSHDGYHRKTLITCVISVLMCDKRKSNDARKFRASSLINVCALINTNKYKENI